MSGALFRRERENPGPILQVSSDAANALDMLALRLEKTLQGLAPDDADRRAGHREFVHRPLHERVDLPGRHLRPGRTGAEKRRNEQQAGAKDCHRRVSK